MTSKLIKVEKLISDFKINSNWQRNCNVWSQQTINSFIDDILNNQPMPPILALDTEEYGKVIIDGKQRICNLKNALKHKGLSDEDRKTILNYKFHVCHYNEEYFIDDDEEFNKAKVVEFFYKTHSRNTKLTSQEARRSIDFEKPYIKFVKKEKESERFQTLLSRFSLEQEDLHHINQRYLDEEFILKILSFYYTSEFSKSPYTQQNIDNLVADKTQKELKDSFGIILKALDTLYKDCDILNAVQFRLKYKGVMPILIGLLGQYDPKDIKNNKKQIREFLNHFWFMRHDDIADKFGIHHNSGSGYYAAVMNLVVDTLDSL